MFGKKPIVPNISHQFPYNKMAEEATPPLPGENTVLAISLARVAGYLMSIRDTDVEDGKMSVGEIMHIESNHLLTPQECVDAARLKAIESRVSRAKAVALQLLILARWAAYHQKPIDLRPLANGQMAEMYAQRMETQRKIETAGTRQVYIDAVVADAGHMLRNHLRQHIVEFLCACDSRMCELRENFTVCGEELITDSILEWIHNVADNLARGCVLDYCHAERNKLVAKNAESYRIDSMSDLIPTAARETTLRQLCALRDVAEFGLSPVHETQYKQLHGLRGLVNSPCTKMTSGEARGAFNLSLLKRAVAVNLNPKKRCALITHWRTHHGDYAVTVVDAHMENIRRAEALPSRNIGAVIAIQDHEDADTSLCVPMPVGIPAANAWVFCKDDETSVEYSRDSDIRRKARLASLVWDMLQHGEFERGMITPELANDVQSRALDECDEALVHINLYRNQKKRGWKLQKVFGNMDLIGGWLETEVAEAMTSLSLFSQERVAQFLNTPVSYQDQNRLSQRTRECALHGSIPEEARNFLEPMMRHVLYLLGRRRNRVGISPSHRSHPVVELLNTCPKVQSWDPTTDGTLRLFRSDIQQAAPSLSEVLKELAKSDQGLVRWTKNRNIHTNFFYSFDTLQLVKLLNRFYDDRLWL
jgi:hypothetical protein